MDGLPRYQNKIYVTEKKHLTRSINKLIEYKDVVNIFLSFDHDDSFELDYDLDDEDKRDTNKYVISICSKDILSIDSSFFLVYDRASAMYKRTNTDCILQAIDIIEMSELFKKDALDKLRELISKYQREDKIFNTFFEQNENDMIDKIKSFIKADGTFIQKPSGKKINTKDMVAKRLYQSVLNRLNYDDDFYFNLSQMNKDKKIDELEYIKNAIENIDNIKNRITEYEDEKRTTFANEHKNSNISYRDCIIGLEFYDNFNVDIDEYYRSMDIELAYAEKIRHEEDIDAEIREYNIKNELTLFIKEEIQVLFKEYVKINKYFKLNKKNYTMNSITRYINELFNHMKILDKLGGIRRRKKVLELKVIYGDDFKAFYKILAKMDTKTKRIFSKQILLLKKYEHLLNEFDDNELDRIFNDTLELNFVPKPELKLITTSYEMKLRDRYYEKCEEFFKLSGEIFELDEETIKYYNLDEKLDNLEKEIEELQKKYDYHDEHKLHPWAKKYKAHSLNKAYYYKV